MLCLHLLHLFIEKIGNLNLLAYPPNEPLASLFLSLILSRSLSHILSLILLFPVLPCLYITLPLPLLVFILPSLPLHSPKTDTFKTCNSYKVQTNAEKDEATLVQLHGEWELHLRKAKRAYQQLKEDTALSKSDANTMVVTFDLQQSFPTPVLTTNVVFYKRQLWTYNLGIHDCRSDSGHMFVWHEGIASRGSHDIGSCILRYIKDTSPTATHLITFSDSCGGQNRNVYMLSLWLYMVASSDYPFTTTDQNLGVGHSYHPNDRDFGSIETARRKTNHLYVPHDWSELILNARRQNPFTVTEMTQEDFVSFEPVSKVFINHKINTVKGKVEWLKIKWIRVTKEKPLQFQYRHSLNTLKPLTTRRGLKVDHLSDWQ